MNIMEFCKAYNAATEGQRGQVIRLKSLCMKTVSFTFITKTPPAAKLILKAAGVPKGSGNPRLSRFASSKGAGQRRSPKARWST